MSRSAAFLLALLFTCPCAWADIPRDPNAELARVQKQNNEQAILFYASQIKNNPADASLYAKRGKAYSDNGDYEHALQDFESSLALDPKLANAYVGRAVVRLMKKDYDKCWEDVHKAESLGAKFWPAFTNTLKKGSGREK